MSPRKKVEIEEVEVDITTTEVIPSTRAARGARTSKRVHTWISDAHPIVRTTETEIVAIEVTEIEDEPGPFDEETAREALDVMLEEPKPAGSTGLRTTKRSRTKGASDEQL